MHACPHRLLVLRMLLAGDAQDFWMLDQITREFRGCSECTANVLTEVLSLTLQMLSERDELLGRTEGESWQDDYLKRLETGLDQRSTG